jgi:hypothetical protein
MIARSVPDNLLVRLDFTMRGRLNANCGEPDLGHRRANLHLQALGHAPAQRAVPSVAVHAWFPEPVDCPFTPRRTPRDDPRTGSQAANEGSIFVDPSLSIHPAVAVQRGQAEPRDDSMRMDAERGWTPDELEDLDDQMLRLILARDMGEERGAKGTRASLTSAILRVQSNERQRGEVRWLQQGQRMVLYTAQAAEQARALVSLVEAVSTWGDLRSAMTRLSPSALEPVVSSLWERWRDGENEAFGVDFEDSIVEDIADWDGLLHAFDDDVPCEVGLWDDEGWPTIVDPYDPYQMGVPLLIIHRYYQGEEEGTPMLSREVLVLDADSMPSVAAALRSIGWNLARGAPEELPFDLQADSAETWADQ